MHRRKSPANRQLIGKVGFNSCNFRVVLLDFCRDSILGALPFNKASGVSNSGGLVLSLSIRFSLFIPISICPGRVESGFSRIRRQYAGIQYCSSVAVSFCRVPACGLCGAPR